MTSPASIPDDERIRLIRDGIETRLKAGASGAPELDRDISSALTELLAARALSRPSVSVDEVSEAEAWCRLAGKAIDALDNIATWEAGDFDRTASIAPIVTYAETAAADIRAAYPATPF